ncbi:hypothetical protein [Phytohabitans aurantiacus]|uniref:Uncharacterized protein n=1 Tax=Phytohabitans aurantiacus TaxID=3016789 RepID=A0ABQ5QTW1_9ACTN|nr:hypothetical protein [Phytohabitans aurantiacus]GLH97351.1 hypothetical protein Pa4123_26260 [Phytohabitans aurantiacus]
MRYKITAPVAGYTGLVAGVAFADGSATIDTAEEKHRRALAYFERKRYGIEQLGIEEPDIEEPDADPPAEEKPTEVPTRGSSKADWVTYVTSEAAGEKRLAQADADAKTRDQLAELVLGPKGGEPA